MDRETLRRLLAEIDEERSAADAAMRLIGPGRRPLEIRNAVEEARRRLKIVRRILAVAEEEEAMRRRDLLRIVPLVAVSPGSVERIAAAHATDDSLVNAYEDVLEQASLAYPRANMSRLYAALDPLAGRVAERLPVAGSRSLRDRLARAASQLSVLAGSAAIVVGQRSRARQHLAAAWRSAELVGDPTLQALALEARSLLNSSVWVGGSAPAPAALDDLRRAETISRSSPPVVRQWILARLARERAAAGDDRFRESLDEASALSGAEDPDPSGLVRRDGFLAFADTRLEDVRGTGLTSLGRGDEAVVILAQQLAEVPAHALRRRSTLMTSLADAHVAQSEPEQAALAAAQSLDLSARSGSKLNVDRVRGVRSRLEPWNDLPAVRDLDEAMAHV